MEPQKDKIITFKLNIRHLAEENQVKEASAASKSQKRLIEGLMTFYGHQVI